MNKILNKGDKKELHKFWDITARGLFFVLFYLFLSLILFIYASTKYGAPLPSIFGFMLFMPIGLLYLLGLFNNTDTWAYHFIYVFDTLLISAAIIISYFRFNRNIILKWLIIALILLVVASFAGCVAYLRDNGYPIGA